MICNAAPGAGRSLATATVVWLFDPHPPSLFFFATVISENEQPRLPLFCPSQIVENCICTLRNLSYRLELELPPARLIGGQELDGLLGSESPSKEVDSSCWGRKKKKKKKSLQEDTVSARV